VDGRMFRNAVLKFQDVEFLTEFRLLFLSLIDIKKVTQCTCNLSILLLSSSRNNFFKFYGYSAHNCPFISGDGAHEIIVLL
jgi:hypothetical protein